MPRHIPYQLQWFAAIQGYAVSQDGRPLVPHIEPASPHWLAWLETTSSFSFQSRSGARCTVRKETVQRGGAYWYAYRRKGGRMVKRYLARSMDLTLAHLETMAATLDEISSEPDFCADAEAIELFQSTKERGAQLSTAVELAPPPLLTTRLHVPRLPVQYVSRPRLLTLLDQGMQGSLTLVSAPAGSGKTTLLAEWATRTAVPVVWISLEAADNDPSRFLAYLLAALASLEPRIAPGSSAGYAHNPEQALTAILNDLTQLLQQEVAVILDDYHLLTADAIHALLRFLLDHLPTHLHLIIGTRVDPPLPLARLRARGQLSEIRIAALRFVSDEVEALVSTMGLALSSEATHLLEQRAEGWIAGVQLLALALRGQVDATAFLKTFRGTHRFLLDYVSEEVLSQQTPETQRFLLRTCVLARLTGPLCDAVTGLPDGQARLADLQRANLFVNALDDTDTWYRYHALFAETLHVHLQKLEPELIPQLYLRASYWYEQHRALEEACDYALLASDFPRAAILVAELLPQMVEQGRIEQLRGWLIRLPSALIAASPQLYVVTPWLHNERQNSPQQMEYALKQMEQHVQKQRQHAPGSWVEPQSILTLFRALTALSHNNLPHAFSLIRKALRVLNGRKTPLSQLLSRLLQIAHSVIYGESGDLGAAEQTLLDLSFTRSGGPFSVVHLAALSLLGELYRAQGQLHKGEALYKNSDLLSELHADTPPVPLLVISFSLLRRASLLYEWDRLLEAASYAQQALEVIPYSVQPSLFVCGLWTQARIAWTQGRSEAARYFFELVHSQPEMMEEPLSARERPPVSMPALAARLSLVCGQLEEAVNWKRACGLSFDDAPETLLEGRQIFLYLTLARVLIAQARSQHTEAELSQALILLEHWQHLALRLKFQGWLIEIQMLLALALQAQGSLEQAWINLGAALVQAEPEGYVRLFADEGQPMRQLLTQIFPYTTASPDYLQRIQSAIPFTHQALLGPAYAEPAQDLPEALSGREREVLSLLAAGFSNQQIAERLVISLHTAKRHVKNILAKLGVTSRLSAVARARELRLL